jgi:glycosyltransferase involved in cell wall biosynthesis
MWQCFLNNPKINKGSSELKKKLVHVSMFYHPVTGGQEVYVENLNEHVLGDYEIHVLQPNNYYSKTWPKNIHRTICLPKINRLIHDLNWFVFNIGIFLKRKFLKNFDVAITHYAFHHKWVARPQIVISHGVDWRVNHSTWSDHYRKSMARKLKEEQGPNVIVANDTNFLREIGFDAENVEPFTEISSDVWYIPNCIDTNLFKCAGLERKKQILCPRNIRWERGIHLAIESLIALAKRKEGDGYVLKIAGGPLKGSYFESCLRLAEASGLEDRIFFLGSQSKAQLLELYQESMLTIIPTMDQEGTSLSALESMACGTPVVATRIGGLIDLPVKLSSVDSESFCESMIEVLTRHQDYSLEQCRVTRTVFNVERWAEAWRTVIKNFSKRFPT